MAGELSRLINRRSFRRATVERPCPDCGGRGRWNRPATAPDGTVPVRRVMLRVQCDTCRGEGKLRIVDEVHEAGRVRVWDHRGRLVIDKPDTPEA